MFASARGILKNRNKYLVVPPCSFHLCVNPEGALEFLDQVRAVDMQQHDPATQQLMTMVGADIVARSQGGEESELLREHLDAHASIDLDDSWGEG